MKKLIFTLLAGVFMYSAANAQYCGASNPSGPTQCTSNGSLVEPGLEPLPEDLQAIVNGVATDLTIQFKNFDNVEVAGQNATIQSLTIDTISNLPSGLCWSTNKTDNTYGNQEDGCIRVVGTANGPIGQYKLNIIVTVDIGLPFNVTTSAEDAGLDYYVRLINAGGNVPCIDTLAGSFLAYTGTEPACPVGIKDAATTLKAISIVPNPMNNSAVVSFVADKSSVMSERVTNMIGAEVSRKNVEVKAGENSLIINRDNLPSGVYFYTLTNGKATKTIRFVID